MTKYLQTPDGPLPYEFERKRVRNINLRIRADGSISVSAPQRMALRDVEAFVNSKADWVMSHRAAIMARPAPRPPRYTKAECLAIFRAYSDAVFPLFSDLLGGQKPALRVRDMKTRWGTCNTATRTITLNMQLAEKPAAAIEYVVLHEYVHFLHPNHSPAFHAEMARLMPDYKARRALLREG